MLGQVGSHVGLDQLFQFRAQRQAPVIEQVLVDPGSTQLLRAHIADKQHLATLFEPFGMPLLETVIHPGTVPAAEPVCLALQPGRRMLRAQTAQATAKHTRGKALEQGQLGNGGKVFRQFGIVLRHADSRV